MSSNILPFGAALEIKGIDYIVSCYDPFRDSYWVRYIDAYGCQYKWIPAKAINIELGKK